MRQKKRGMNIQCMEENHVGDKENYNGIVGFFFLVKMIDLC